MLAPHRRQRLCACVTNHDTQGLGCPGTEADPPGRSPGPAPRFLPQAERRVAGEPQRWAVSLKGPHHSVTGTFPLKKVLGRPGFVALTTTGPREEVTEAIWTGRCKVISGRPGRARDLDDGSPRPTLARSGAALAPASRIR